MKSYLCVNSHGVFYNFLQHACRNHNNTVKVVYWAKETFFQTF